MAINLYKDNATVFMLNVSILGNDKSLKKAKQLKKTFILNSLKFKMVIR